MCVDCVLASPRIAQVGPGDGPLSEVVLSQYSSLPTMPHLSPTHHETSKHVSPHETDSRVEPSKFSGFKFKSRQVNYSSQIKPKTTCFLNGEAHWTIVKYILKYLRRTKEAFLVFGGEEELIIKGYSDASFQTDAYDYKSQSGFFVLPQ
jgi:hypothetical protein